MSIRRGSTDSQAAATQTKGGASVTPSAGDRYAEREQWLYRVAEALYPKFTKLEYPDRPSIRVGVGFPSTGARGKAIGQCYHSRVSKDRVHEIIVSPKIDDTVEVAGVLAHELCHAYLQSYLPDETCGHGKKFRRLAVALGLTGQMRSTVPGEAFKRFLQPVLDTIGQYPHGALDSSSAGTRRVQGTRLVKVSCPSCQYTIRVTNKWIDVAVPTCPSPGCDLFNEPMEVAK